MTTYLGKSCSFGLPRVPFVNCRRFVCLVVFPFGFGGGVWDLIVSVPDHCLSFYFSTVGFLLFQCSSGVVRHPGDLRVSVATRSCRVLIFASS